ncbi:MAG: hypothetical protein ACE5KY_06515, partial [Candidatus Tectimicrobiota bacterium]
MPRNDRLLTRTHLNEHAVLVIAGLLNGVLGGVGAIVFRFMIKMAERLFYGPGHDLLEIARHLPAHHKIIAPIIGGLIVGPVI